MSDDKAMEGSAAPAEEKPRDCTEVPAKPPRKKRLRKWLGITAAVLAVLLAAVLICRDFLIEQGFRRIGSWLVGTPVELESFSSSLFAGSVEISNLTVGNPEGYHAPHIFSLRRIFVDLEPLSLFTEKIVVEEITIEGMRVDFESKITETNLGVIQENVNRKLGAAGADRKTPESPDTPGDGGEKPQKQLVIRKLEVRDYSASISAKMLKSSLVLPLVPVSMTDVGEGRPIGETVSGLFGSVASSVSSAVTKSGGAIGAFFKETGGLLGDSAHNAGSALRDAGAKLTELLKK